MDSKQFGKIRNATRSIAAQRANAEKLDSPNIKHIREAISYIRSLQKRDENEAKNYVDAHADLWRERLKMGEKSWNILNGVSNEKWEVEMQQLRPQLDEIVRTAEDGYDASMRFRDAIRLAISRTTDAGMSDPRIEEAFPGGKKKKLEKVVRSFNARTKVVQEDVIRDIERLYGIRSEDDEGE